MDRLPADCSWLVSTYMLVVAVYVSGMSMKEYTPMSRAHTIGRPMTSLMRFFIKSSNSRSVIN